MNNNRTLTVAILDELDDIFVEFAKAEAEWDSGNGPLTDDEWCKVRDYFQDQLSWYASDLLAAARKGMTR